MNQDEFVVKPETRCHCGREMHLECSTGDFLCYCVNKECTNYLKAFKCPTTKLECVGKFGETIAVSGSYEIIRLKLLPPTEV